MAYENKARKRFEEKFVRRGKDECWLWLGSETIHGYGTFHYKGKTCKAPRIAYEFYCGPIPEGMCILHSCDNPPCVNPNHLSVGTMKDNCDDMGAKGRHSFGISSVLTEADVLEIRNLLLQGYTHREIADIFNVGKATITNINLNRTWRHL